MTVCPTVATVDAPPPLAAVWACRHSARPVLWALSLCLLTFVSPLTRFATASDEPDEASHVRGPTAAATGTAETAPTEPQPEAKSAPEEDIDLPAVDGEISLQLNRVVGVAVDASGSAKTGQPSQGSSWLPRTILGYDVAVWQLPPIQPAPPEPARVAMPLLIQDAVSGANRLPKPQASRLAVGGSPVSPPRPSPQFHHVNIVSSVGQRRDTDTSGTLRNTPLLKPQATGQQSTKDPAVEDLPAAESKLANRNRSAPSAAPPAAEPVDDKTPEIPLAAPLATPPTEPALAITREMGSLRPRLDKVLRFYFDRPLNTQDDGPWSIMHSLLGYGMNTPVALHGPQGRRRNALRWMADNNPCARRQLLYLTQEGVAGREGAGFQGHPGQFLAMLAQIDVPADYPLKVQGQSRTVADLVRAEMLSCSVSRELTFSLIGLSHYLTSDARWLNREGEPWDLGKILGIELAQPVNGAACGGTHRIMAISYAVLMKQRRDETLSGPYLRAQQYVRDYHRYAMSLQTQVGGFSSDWFKRRTEWGDPDRQLQTTGHILEWLVFSLPRNELADRRIVRAVDFLTNHMTQNRFRDWEVGPRGHALRALSLYQRRVFTQQSRASTLAQR